MLAQVNKKHSERSRYVTRKFDEEDCQRLPGEIRLSGNSANEIDNVVVAAKELAGHVGNLLCTCLSSLLSIMFYYRFILPDVLLLHHCLTRQARTRG